MEDLYLLNWLAELFMRMGYLPYVMILVAFDDYQIELSVRNCNNSQ